jgi:hypothetical protein
MSVDNVGHIELNSFVARKNEGLLLGAIVFC